MYTESMDLNNFNNNGDKTNNMNDTMMTNSKLNKDASAIHLASGTSSVDKLQVPGTD